MTDRTTRCRDGCRDYRGRVPARRLRRGPGAWLLAGTAWLLLGTMRALLVFVPFKRTMALLGMRIVPPADVLVAAVPVDPDDPGLGRVPWAITAAMRRTPWESKCLAQALAGSVMLRAGGEPSRVYFGVRPADPGQDRAMTAHAWLVSRGRILTGADGHEEYTVVAAYAAGRTSD